MSATKVTSDDKVGVIGLGRIGGGIATRFCDAGWKTVVYDKFPEAAEKFRDR